jgi:hypothetical protein
MPGGTPVYRQWVSILNDGMVVVDWGDGLLQDVFSGDFLPVDEPRIGHPVQNTDLEILLRASRISHYDAQQVWFINLPERPTQTID